MFLFDLYLDARARGPGTSGVHKMVGSILLQGGQWSLNLHKKRISVKLKVIGIFNIIWQQKNFLEPYLKN